MDAEHVSALPDSHGLAGIECSTPCSLDIISACKERSQNQSKQQWKQAALTKYYISGRVEAWLCVCASTEAIIIVQMKLLLHYLDLDLHLDLHLDHKAITTLQFDVQLSKWGSCTDVSGRVECAVNTQHQHKAIYCSAPRAEFCHQCFNQVTSQDICLMALAVFYVCDRYSTQIYRALCHCSVHCSHFIFLYIILTSVKFLLWCFLHSQKGKNKV